MIPPRLTLVGTAGSAMPDTSPKAFPGDEGAVAVDMFVVRGLRAHQGLVSTYIRGYLVLEELQEKCRDARDFSEQGPRGVGALSQLRKVTWEDVHGVHVQLPEGLNELTGRLDAEIEAVKDAFYADDNPYLDDTADAIAFARFASRLSRHLSIAMDASTEAAGTCRNKGLEALDQLARYVDSIFNRTEEARRTAPFGNRVDAAPTTPDAGTFAGPSGTTADSTDKAPLQRSQSSVAPAR